MKAFGLLGASALAFAWCGTAVAQTTPTDQSDTTASTDAPMD